MSTPSTATSTVPAHHSQYGYAHHNPYSNNTSSYPANNSLPAPRLTNSYHTFPSAGSTQPYSRPQPPPIMTKQPSQSNSLSHSQSTSALSRSKRKPDWNDFYKNGVPDEIIVIDSDDENPNHQPRGTGARQRGAAEALQPNAGKKRKLDQGYEVEYHDSPTFSTHPAKFGNSSSASIGATDRTASLQTTAPTSLESYGRNGASNSYEDIRQVGQKRKRAPPPKETQTRAQLRKRQQEAASDAFADYIPPSKPLRKAADVHVQVIRDVSVLCLST